MTTMGGRSAQYVPGREPVNKEPSVSKFVVEKLYKVHRERIVTMEPIVDCHVFVPDFLKGGQEWKRNAERTRVNRILKENQNIYKRIEKVDKEEGYFTKESRTHVRRVEAKLKYLRKLKDHGRVVDILKRQKENEHFLKRIENAVPQYSKKKMKDWYKYHEQFKQGRRSDPTAGHIMHGIKKTLLPSSLPPLSRQHSLSNSSSILRSLNSVSASNDGRDRDRDRMVDAMSLQSFNSQTVLSYDKSVAEHPRYVLQENNNSDNNYNYNKKQTSSTNSKDNDNNNTDNNNNYNHVSNSSFVSEASSFHSQSPQSLSLFRKNDVNLQDVIDSLSTGDYSNTSDQWETESADSRKSARKKITTTSDDFVFLAQAQFPLSIDTKNCHVQVHLAKQYDENFYLKAVSTGFTPHVYAQRTIDVDSVYEMIGSASANLKNLGSEVDLKELTDMLLKLFKETDLDGTGSLTYSEFQMLMEKIDLGISPQELNFVICEADEDENGAVDYQEFVPLAVDLIQSFRARNRARIISNQEDQLTDEHIMKSMPLREIEMIADTCLSKLSDVDSKGYGILKVVDFKKALSSIGYMVGLKEKEITMLSKILPKDQFDRVKYNSTGFPFKDAFSQARFMTIKAALLESRSSGLEKRLMDACKREEEKTAIDMSYSGSFEPTGQLPVRCVVNILSNTSSLALSRMQVMVLIADATVVDNMIDYVNFIPVVSKAIELMFDPKTIRLRAELIEQTDLSTEALLGGLSTEDFVSRLRSLFKSYDVDGSGSIDFDEFISCMEALDLQLSYAEMVTMMDTADEDHNGSLQFGEFVEFFTHNLLNLEREKHLRRLQSSIHELAVVDPDQDGLDEVAHNEALVTFSTEITALFKMFDHDHSGLISYKDFQSVLSSVSMKFSSYLVDILKAEIHADANGMVDYGSTINTCVDLAKVMVAKEVADDEHAAQMKWADEKAVKILTEQREEIDHIVTYLMLKLKIVSDRDDISSDFSRFHEMENVLNDPHSGLSHSESHLLISKLFQVSEKELTDIENTVDQQLHIDTGEDKQTGEEDREQSLMHKRQSAENLFIHNAKENRIKNSPQSRTENRRGTNLHSDSGHIEFKLNITPTRRREVHSSFTKEELYRHVFEVRKLSVIRRLMNQVESTDLKRRILKLLHEEKETLVAEERMNSNSNDLPISVYFKVLESAREFMLSKANVIFIISSIENHDRSTIPIEFFAEHASIIIAKLQASASQTVRAGVVSKTKISDKKVLNGWRVKDLEVYLTDAFHAASNGEGEILSEMKFWHVIKTIPRLNLTDLEATTITSSFSNSMKWEDAVLPTVNIIRQLCREKFINRRMNILASVNDDHDNEKSKKFGEESMASLVNIAKRFLTVVKVSVQGENVVLTLPTDDTKHVVASAYRRDDDYVGEEDEEVHEVGKEAHALFKGELAIPFLTMEKRIKTPKSKKGKKEEASKEEIEWTVKKETVGVKMKIIAIEDVVMFSSVILIADIVSLDGNMSVSNPLNVRLPSVVLMDRDSAELFIENLIPTIYVEINGESITVKVEGD